jgi:UDP-glucose 4-epimerase
LVTGGAGFVGSHLVERLLGDGANVVVLDDLSTGKEVNLPAEASLEVADVSDGAAVERIVAAAKPELVFHLAAQASVTVSVADPPRDAEVNVTGTINVLEAARRAGAPVVFASTGGALYGDDVARPTPESVEARPGSPYGASKLAGEAYVGAWNAMHSAQNAICRLGNVYGPRQNPEGEAGVVAIFSRKAWSGETPVLYGHGKPTRDYVHAADIADGLVRAAGRPGTYNLGTGREAPVSQIWETVRDAAGATTEAEMQDLRPGELMHSCLDSSRAAQELGWKPQVELDDGLRQTYAALSEAFAAA